MNTVNDPEPYTFKKLIVCCINFTSIKSLVMRSNISATLFLGYTKVDYNLCVYYHISYLNSLLSCISFYTTIGRFQGDQIPDLHLSPVCLMTKIHSFINKMSLYPQSFHLTYFFKILNFSL